MMSLPLAPEEQVALAAVAASLGEGRGDVSVHELAGRLGGDETEASGLLEQLAQSGVLERVDQSPLYAGMDVPALYSVADRLAQDLSPYGVEARPRLTSLEDFHSFEPVESFDYPAWVHELGL